MKIYLQVRNTDSKCNSQMCSYLEGNLCLYLLSASALHITEENPNKTKNCKQNHDFFFKSTVFFIVS